VILKNGSLPFLGFNKGLHHAESLFP
jgi:hypothetical protein